MIPAATVEDGGRRLRIFCALTLGDEVLDAVCAWQEQTLAGVHGVRAVTRASLHVTLAFLGSRPESDVPAIAGALGAAVADAGPPVLSVRRYRETRSVGMLVLEETEPRHAHRLAGRLMRALADLGVYEPERRDWLPHLTVSRFRARPRLQPEPPDLGAFSPSGAAVYHSLLRHGGAEYEVLESFALGGR